MDFSSPRSPCISNSSKAGNSQSSARGARATAILILAIILSHFPSAQSAQLEVTLTGQWTNASPAARDIVVAGRYAYLAESGAGIQIVNVSNPIKPETAGRLSTSDGSWGVAISSNRLYVAVGPAGLEIVDVSDADSPQRIGGVGIPGD